MVLARTTECPYPVYYCTGDHHICLVSALHTRWEDRSRVEGDKRTEAHGAAKIPPGCVGRSDRRAQSDPESGQAVPPSQGQSCSKSFIVICGIVARSGRNWPYFGLTGARCLAIFCGFLFFIARPMRTG